MINPFFAYVVAFCLALIAYSFGWSDLYPPLSLELFLFLTMTISICIVAGIRAWRSKLFRFDRLHVAGHAGACWLTLFVYTLWSAEFIHAGGIPFLKIILGRPYDYRFFGIPTFHVFVVTFSSFCTIFIFHLYLSRPSRLMLLLYLLNLLSAILIYNRGMLLFNLTASACLFLMSQRKFSWKYTGLVVVAVVILLYGFGVLGSLRISREARRSYSNDYFLEISGARQSFRQSILPGELFWSYIYLSSPLANLQQNIQTAQPTSRRPGEVLHWVNNELVFDFISKRVNAMLNTTRKPVHRIEGPFNAATIYARSYSYLGWAGLTLMFIAILLLPGLVLQVLPHSSPFFLTGVAILNTMFVFMIFENTISFTGLSFQLVYPVLLRLVCEKFPRCLTSFVNNKVTTPEVKRIQTQ